MNDKSIVKNATKYFLAVIVTMYLWQFAAKLVTANNDIENIIGFFVYFVMSITWFLMLKRDIIIAVSKLNK